MIRTRRFRAALAALASLAAVAALVLPALLVPATASAATGPSVLLIVEENHALNEIYGNPAAPYFTSLADSGTLLTNSWGVRHPSLPNYISLLLGSTGGISTDCTTCHVAGPNLVDQLETAGLSWHGYMEELPKACSSVVKSGAYVKRHDPFMYLDTVRSNPARCSKVVPVSNLIKDAKANKLPRFSFVSPNLQHDIHDGTVAQANTWLQNLITQLKATPAWKQHDLRVIVTFDEDDNSTGVCCDGLGNGGHIYTAVFGPKLPAGLTDDTAYTHYSVLHSIEQLFGLPALGNAATVPTIPVLAGS